VEKLYDAMVEEINEDEPEDEQSSSLREEEP
jgi:hypothetical protein